MSANGTKPTSADVQNQPFSIFPGQSAYPLTMTRAAKTACGRRSRRGASTSIVAAAAAR